MFDAGKEARYLAWLHDLDKWRVKHGITREQSASILKEMMIGPVDIRLLFWESGEHLEFVPRTIEDVSRPVISSFCGEFAFLSNFYPCEFTYAGPEQVWPTAEHAFQAAKTNDLSVAEDIRLQLSPGKAKKIGRSVTLRPDWEKIKLTVMHDVVFAKFYQNRELRDKLLLTGGSYLIEGNSWHDNTWGNCTCPKCADKPGQNLLGWVLMRVRDNLSDGYGEKS